MNSLVSSLTAIEFYGQEVKKEMGRVTKLYTSEVRRRSAMTEYRYYTYLSDLEVEERIRKLSPNQTKKYIEAELKGIERRQALFIAGSYSIEEEVEK